VTGSAQVAEHERRYQELRLRVQQRHAAATALEEDDPGFDPAVSALVEATDALIAYSDRLPVLRDLPARAVSVQTVRAGALAALLGGALIGLEIWWGTLGWGWLPVVLITLLAALRTATLSVAPAAGQHRRQRYASAGCGVAALLIGPAAMEWGWWAGLGLAVVHALCLAVLLELIAAPKEQA
jgi:hypothetical protein